MTDLEKRLKDAEADRDWLAERLETAIYNLEIRHDRLWDALMEAEVTPLGLYKAPERTWDEWAARGLINNVEFGLRAKNWLAEARRARNTKEAI